MKHRVWLFQIVVSISLMLALVFSPYLATPAGANPDTIIDTFETTQTVTRSGVGTSNNSVTGAGILGTERDVTTGIVGTGSGVDQTAAANGGGLGQFSHSAQAGVTGYTLVQWDGASDAGDPAIDPDGLGSIDLTTGGDNYFIVSLIGADLDTSITVVFWDYAANSASTCSAATRLLPTLNSNFTPRAILIPYSAFAPDGVTCTAGADITNVGAIALLVDGRLVESADVTIDLIKTGQLDFGDHQDPLVAYHTQLDDQFDGNVLGAGHVLNGLYLGASVDGELDGQPTADSDGDDTIGVDDEDGVVQTPSLVWAAGSATGGSVDVTVNGGDGCLYGWIDWNRGGSFGNSLTTTGVVGANDRVLNGIQVSTGTNTYTFPTPSDIDWDLAPLNARFRLYPRDPGGSCSILVGGTGTGYLKYSDRFLAVGGEVEDHRWNFGPNAVTVSSLSAKTETANTAGLALLAVTVIGLGMVGLVMVRRSKAH